MTRSFVVLIQQPGVAIQKKTFLKPRVMIGRLPSSDIHLTSQKVSRVHAMIEFVSENKFLVSDLSSSHGTWFEGQKITTQEIEFKNTIIAGDCKITILESTFEDEKTWFQDEMLDAPETQQAVIAAKVILPEAPVVAAPVKTPSPPPQPAAPIAQQPKPAKPIEVNPPPQFNQPDGDSVVFEVSKASVIHHHAAAHLEDREPQRLMSAQVAEVDGKLVLPRVEFERILNSKSQMLKENQNKSRPAWEFTLYWGEKIMNVDAYRGKNKIRVGSHHKNNYVIPSADVIDEKHKLLGTYKEHCDLFLTDKMQGTLRIEGKLQPVSSFITAYRTGKPSVVRLQADDFAKLQIGNFSVFLMNTNLPDRLPQRKLGGEPLAMKIYLSTWLLIMGLVGVLNLIPVSHEEVKLENVPERFVRIITEPPIKKIQKPKIVKVIEKISRGGDEGEGAAKAGLEGKTGKKDASQEHGQKNIPPAKSNDTKNEAAKPMPKKDKAEKVIAKGTKIGQNPDKIVEKSLGADRAGRLEKLKQAAIDKEVAEGKALAQSLMSDVGDIFGETGTGSAKVGRIQGDGNGELNDSVGSGGAGLKDAGGTGGGGTTLEGRGYGHKGSGAGKTGDGLGSISGKGKFNLPGGTGGEEADIGKGLTREQIERVVKAHLSEIKFCYEQGRKSKYTLRGKVTIYWIVVADGTVKITKVQESSLGHPETEDCIRKRILRWQFDQPVGGSDVEVEVKYPFLLNPE